MTAVHRIEQPGHHLPGAALPFVMVIENVLQTHQWVPPTRLGGGGLLRPAREALASDPYTTDSAHVAPYSEVIATASRPGSSSTAVEVVGPPPTLEP